MRKIAIIIAVVLASLSASAQTQEDSVLVEQLKAMTIEQVEIHRRKLDIIHRRWLFLQSNISAGWSLPSAIKFSSNPFLAFD